MVLSLAVCGSREAASSHSRPEFHGTMQKPDVRGTLEGCIFADSALNFYQYGYTVRNCVFLGNCVVIETWDRTAIATTLQIPVPERQYNADLMRPTHYPAWNMNFFFSIQNSPMTRQLMAELGSTTP